MSPYALMYVKEDTIIPYDTTFHDLIDTQQRGKNNMALYHFNVFKDVRLVHDPRVKTEHSHAGRIVLLNWYKRNKHLKPAKYWVPLEVLKEEKGVV